MHRYTEGLRWMECRCIMMRKCPDALSSSDNFSSKARIKVKHFQNSGVLGYFIVHGTNWLKVQLLVRNLPKIHRGMGYC